MRNTIKFSTLLLTLLMFSCEKDNNINEIKSLTKVDMLTNKTWKKDFFETYYYYNGTFDHISTDNTNAGIEKLTFNINTNVLYENPNFTEPINGIWALDGNNEFLTTNLKKQMPSSSGYSSFYFYTHNKILELSESKLVLESDHTYSTFSNSNGTTSGEEFTRYYFKN